jgi:phage baseplate assembly protein W
MNALDLEVLSLGTDLVLPTGAVRPTPSGDWPEVSGRECFRADLLERAMTTPGGLTHRPTYGAGLERFIETTATPEVRAQIVAAVRGNLERDPRIAEVAVRVAAPVGGRTIVTLLTQIRTGATQASPEELSFALE